LVIWVPYKSFRCIGPDKYDLDWSIDWFLAFVVFLGFVFIYYCR
jgi:hypothetical protein